jgi:predicted phage terminase large subunit-like protein
VDLLTVGGVCIKCEVSRTSIAKKRFDGGEKKLHERNARAVETLERIAINAARIAEERKGAVEARRKQLEQDEFMSAQREQASRDLARTSLLHYVERRDPSYTAGWVHELIAQELERFADDVVNKRSPRLVLCVPSRAGKGCSDSTPVMTPTGWTTHGALRPGDYVFALDGKPTKVVRVADPVPCGYAVDFSSGDTLHVHSPHEWVVRSVRQNTWTVMETSALYDAKTVHFRADRPHVKQHRYHVPDTPTLQIPERVLPMDPFALGCYLADGTKGTNIVSQHIDEPEVAAELVRRGYDILRARDEHTHSCTRYYMLGRDGKPFVDELRAAGVHGTKHVPHEFLYSSEQQRRDLLSGLVACDGDVEKAGRIRFTNTNKNLVDAVEWLWRSLGEIPSVGLHNSGGTVIRKRDDREFTSVEQPAWRVCVTPRHTTLPLHIPHKDRRCRVSGVARKHFISDVRTLDEDNAPMGRCIQVEAPDGMYLVGKNMIPTHNSELASNSFPAWLLGNHPELSVVVSSYSDDLPTKFSRSIRAQLISPEYRETFPGGAVLHPDDTAVKAWSTVQGGSLRAVGVGGGILGFGAHVFVIDDAVKDMEQADNPEQLEKVWDWMTSTAMTRQMPGAGILVIMQRMAARDLVGRIQEQQADEESRLVELREDAAALAVQTREALQAGDNNLALELDTDRKLIESEAKELDESMDRWRVVEYPALAKHDEYLSPDGDIVRDYGGAEFADKGWRLLRRAGEALHPERYTRYHYLKLKRANPRRFAAMCQLEPVAEGQEFFVSEDLKPYRTVKRPKHLTVYCAWDLAIGTKQSNDFTVGLAVGVDHNGNHYVLDRVKGRFGDLERVADMVIDLHVKWHAVQTGVERTHLEMALGPTLQRKMRERKEFIALAEGKEALKPIHDKKVRARTLQGLAKAGMFYVPEGSQWDDFRKALIDFPGGAFDDDVDAASWAAILSNRHGLPRDPKEELGPKPTEKTWWEELLESLEGQGGSYMEA